MQRYSNFNLSLQALTEGIRIVYDPHVRIIWQDAPQNNEPWIGSGGPVF